ncbi:MAG: hypothetical protein ACREUZ_14710, partial [Burkholderiales bacterium]
MHTRRSGLHPALMQGQPHIIDRIVDSAGALQRVLRAEPQRVALDVLVDGAVSLARRALAAAAPAIEVRHEPHPYMLEVDAARLQRAIAALIVSAVKGRAPSAPKGKAPSAPSPGGAQIVGTPQDSSGPGPRLMLASTLEGDPVINREGD